MPKALVLLVSKSADLCRQGYKRSVSVHAYCSVFRDPAFRNLIICHCIRLVPHPGIMRYVRSRALSVAVQYSQEKLPNEPVTH